MKTPLQISVAWYVIVAAFTIFAWSPKSGYAGEVKICRFNLLQKPESKSLKELDDRSLNSLLQSLRDYNYATVKDGTYFDFSDSGAADIVAVPLERAQTPGAILYLYFMPKTGTAVFVQIMRNAQKANRLEMRLWSDGAPEIVIADDQFSVLEQPSIFTFRLVPLPTDHASASNRSFIHSRAHAISCIAKTLGLELDRTSFLTTLSSIVCSADSGADLWKNRFAAVQTAIHCFNMLICLFPPGPCLATSSIACLKGIVPLVACAIVNCSDSDDPPSSNRCIEAISFNTPVTDSWTRDCPSTGRNGSFAQFYNFSLLAHTRIQIDLESRIDPFLILRNGHGTDGSILANNDDAPGLGLNSRIFRTLAPGNYTIEATTYNREETGPFLLSLFREYATLTPPNTDFCMTPITLNTSVNGAWASACPSIGRSGRFAQYYSFTLLTQAMVQIDLQSNTDPYVILRNGHARDGSILADNDDADGLNSRVVVTLAPGFYTIEATTYEAGATGSFLLLLSTQ